jgi:serine/threonine protein kinase
VVAQQPENSNAINNHLKLKKKQNIQDQNVRLVGDYILGETLGMGGYSKVKLGIHKDTGEKVALKIMFADESGNISDSKKKQLRRELNVMKKVKHQNVIQLIDFNEDVEYPDVGVKHHALSLY